MLWLHQMPSLVAAEECSYCFCRHTEGEEINVYSDLLSSISDFNIASSKMESLFILFDFLFNILFENTIYSFDGTRLLTYWESRIIVE